MMHAAERQRRADIFSGNIAYFLDNDNYKEILVGLNSSFARNEHMQIIGMTALLQMTGKINHHKNNAILSGIIKSEGGYIVVGAMQHFSACAQLQILCLQMINSLSLCDTDCNCRFVYDQHSLYIRLILDAMRNLPQDITVQMHAVLCLTTLTTRLNFHHNDEQNEYLGYRQEQVNQVYGLKVAQASLREHLEHPNQHFEHPNQHLDSHTHTHTHPNLQEKHLQQINSEIHRNKVVSRLHESIYILLQGFADNEMNRARWKTIAGGDCIKIAVNDMFVSLDSGCRNVFSAPQSYGAFHHITFSALKLLCALSLDTNCAKDMVDASGPRFCATVGWKLEENEDVQLQVCSILNNVGSVPALRKDMISKGVIQLLTRNIQYTPSLESPSHHSPAQRHVCILKIRKLAGMALHNIALVDVSGVDASQGESCIQHAGGVQALMQMIKNPATDFDGVRQAFSTLTVLAQQRKCNQEMRGVNFDDFLRKEIQRNNPNTPCMTELYNSISH